MKSPIILATLLAGSLAAVPPFGFDCLLAKTAIGGGIQFVWPSLPEHVHKKKAIEVGAAIFLHVIGCGPAPPEAEAPPPDEQVDCRGKVDDTIRRGAKVLRAGFRFCAPARYNEGVTAGIKGFKTTWGCMKQTQEVVIVNVEPAECKSEISG